VVTEYYGFAQRRRGPEWGGIIAWIVILTCVGFVAYKVTRAYARAAARGEDPGGDVQIVLLGRMAVGMNVLTGSVAPPTTQTAASQPTTAGSSSKGAANPASEYVKSVEEAAKTTEEKLEAATVVAEIDGAEAALKRLDELEEQLRAKSESPSSAPAPAPTPTPTPATAPTTAGSTASLEEDLAALRTIYTKGVGALSEQQKQQLIARYDYFGRLATTYGLPKDNPARAAVLRESLNKLIVLIVVGLLFVLLLALALATFITAIVLGALGKFRRAYVPEPFVNSAYVEAFAWYLVLFLLFGLALRKFNEDAGLGWEWVAFVIVPITMMWVRWRGNPPTEVQRGFGWYVPTNVWREIGCGVAGWFAGVPVVALGLLISTRLNKMVGASPTHPIVHMLREAGTVEVLLLYSVAAVFAPVVEETMFRGAMFHHMRRRWGWWISASLVALIFAGIHPQGWTMIPTLGAIAMVLAALREWRGSLIASMAAHATNNFIILSLGLAIAR
jgi:membrane protease YdiL (CAAX protease family)